jgi:aminoglycoside phosphotransferase (APT) family kinase protein
MDVAAATRELNRVLDEPVRQVRAIGHGWGSWTFEVDGRYVARFPRSAEVGRRTQAELTLLPRLGAAVGFAVPSVRWLGTADGIPFVVYEMIRGHALSVADLAAHPQLVHAVAGALRQLHDLDPRDLAETCGEPGNVTGSAGGDAVEAWKNRYERLRHESNVAVVPLLDPSTAGRLAAAWDGFGAALSFTPSFVHADLGVEHILVLGDRLSGIIDWETARVGDPAIDFVGLHIDLGPAWTRQVLDAYGGAGAEFRARSAHYVWIGALEAILYGLRERRPELVRDACNGLRDRLCALDAPLP